MEGSKITLVSLNKRLVCISEWDDQIEVFFGTVNFKIFPSDLGCVDVFDEYNSIDESDD